MNPNSAIIAGCAPASAECGFDVEAFGCRVRASANTFAGKRALARSIFPSLPRSGDGVPIPDVTVRIEEMDGQFSLLVNRLAVATAPTASMLEPAVVRILDDAVVGRLRGLSAVHAGVVAWQGQAVVLPGSSHFGKSTLVAELVRLGATYYSDEYGLIDAEGRVHAYPRPMLLRNGRPEAVATPVQEPGTAPVPVRWILALRYEPGCLWNPVEVDQAQAVLTLLRSTPHVLATTPEIVRAFERAVAGAQCFTGCRPEAALAAGEILRLIG